MGTPRPEDSNPDYQTLSIAAVLLSGVAVALPLYLGARNLAAFGAVFTLTLFLMIRLDARRGGIARFGIHLTLPVGIGLILTACYDVGISNVIAVHFSAIMVLMASHTLGAKAALAWSIPCAGTIVFTVLYPPEITRDVGPGATVFTRVTTLVAILAFSVSFRLRQDRQARELSHQALTDPLTGLANRRQLEAFLREAIERSHRFGRRCGVVFGDLDGLKRINDEHGHAVGDQILSAVSARIKASTRRIDCVARLGGDEFVIVLSEVTNESSVETFAESLLQEVCTPVQLGGSELTPSISLGATLYTGSSEESTATLLRRADRAMYEAKQSGGGCVVFDRGGRGAL